MHKSQSVVLALIVAVATFGCGSSKEEAAPPEPVAAKERARAIAYINPRSGSDASGSAIFILEHGTIELQVSLENTAPGKHAVHIHEKGDCSADDASSAGGHWNPTGHDHGQWDHAPFHLGDIGNVEVGADGKGQLTLSTDKWEIGTGGPHDIVGKAVIVHADADDFTTQPTGNAGGRIGCGVIQ